MASPGSPPASELPPELAPLVRGDPARIGPYRVVGRLGAGGMGAVYGALDDSGRCIAVKVVHPKFAADPRFRTAFAREVELMRRVGGLCTAEVLAADAAAPRPWMATEFVAGRTLRAHVGELGPLTGEVLDAFAAGTAEALASVHAAGIVHCDVKPANVILSPDGPKVLDFGIARTVTASTPAGEGVFGSPGWMSPERLSGAEPTAAGDMFAWGGMVAFAATGRAPFGRAEARELLRRTREDPPDIEGVPAELLPLVERALSKDPGTRPSSEEAFHAVLARAESTPGTGADAVPAPSPGGSLGELLRRVWTGFDAPWHRPALWLAAAPVLGAAGGTVLAGAVGTGGAVGASGAAGAGGAAAGGAGSAAVAGSAGTAAAGTATAGAATAAGTKLAGLVAAGALAAGAAGGGGYYAYGALTALTPAETLDRAARLVSDSRSFQARQTDEFTLDGAESPDAVVEEVTEHRYNAESAADYSQIVVEREQGDDAVTGSARIGETLVYRVADGWTSEDPDPETPAPGMEYYSPEWIAADLRAMADGSEITEHEEDTELDGTPATHYTGSFTATVVDRDSGEQVDAAAEFDVWIDAEGFPLRSEAAFDDGADIGARQTTVSYSAFDQPVEIPEPKPSEVVAGRCDEEVVSPNNNEAIALEPATPGVTCAEAVDVLEGYFALPPEEIQGSGAFGTYEGWECGWVPLGMQVPGEPIGSCEQEGTGAAIALLDGE
ncbi:serine/threonine protein kinase [Murinocardiopsis flavida]|uniref:Serine/threonine protein kinase n=1 Tax=Murinocardiopsis flavida TaxID=645275 RepID=A0A2P8D6Z1_9ACTN|nr:protein kinase [Murinocardiopsis flavida]PSK92959.1 serine/threonine protein kinase [Murinocardiopsis flavida]